MGPPSFLKYVFVKAAKFSAYPVCILVLLWVRIIDPSYYENIQITLIKEILKLLYEWNIYVGVFFAALAVVSPKPQNTFRPNRYASKVRRGILKNVVSDVFGGNTGSKRVTIFTECGPIRNKLYNWLRKFGYWKKKLNPLAGEPQWLEDGQYLVIRERVGEDRRAIQNTRFYCHYSREEKCEGIAAQSLRAGTVKDVSDLPDISDVDLNKVDWYDGEINSNELSAEDINRVKEYMDKSKIKLISSIKQIKMPAQHVWSSPIYNEIGVKIGAIVVDSSAEESFLEEGFTGSMQPYIENLSQTYLDEPYSYYA